MNDTNPESNKVVKQILKVAYPSGFIDTFQSEQLPIGLTEETVRSISKIKNEPDFLLEWRLKAFAHWQTLEPPTWANLKIAPIDFQAIHYYSAPKNAKPLSSLDELDPELRATYDKLGISLIEQHRLSNVAIDAIYDSVSVATTFKTKLAESGVIFCSFSEAVQNHPELVKKYLGSVVSIKDNFYAALNAAVFSDGSFCYIPKDVICPMDLSTYFRINAANTGQFERTLIIAEPGSFVNYLEGCTAPMRDENQLHAAVVELIAFEDATIHYSTVQNWYPGDKNGQGGIYNFVTKRGLCKGKNSKISWTQVETGSAITWKYPSVVLQGDNSSGEFFSIAITKGHQQADTGTKMIHIGNHTTSTIVSKGIAADFGQNTYRGLIDVSPHCHGAKNHTQCDSLLFGPHAGAHTFPTQRIKNATAMISHEATTSRLDEKQLLYCAARGFTEEEATGLIINGFCKTVFKKLPLEFAVEAQKLVNLTLEGTTG